MDAKRFAEIIDADFYSGVPDSQLRALCDYLIDTYGLDPKHHVIAANEGNACAIAAGYHLATGKIPVVYMQNSGEGNIINPCASLLNSKVYAIPVIFIIGWRGEPGVHDEPQHIYQGEVTLRLLEDMSIKYHVISADTSEQEVISAMKTFREYLSAGEDAAFVIRKGALTYDVNLVYHNDYSMTREEIIRHIIKYSGEDAIISTTGKASRELYELRETHERDFLTVGSMGHASSIALGVALNKPERKVWCIDGDGSVLMHMGSLALNGSIKPSNLIHIVINNSAHESVGGLPTCAGRINLADTAESCGYEHVFRVNDYAQLDEALNFAKRADALTFIEAKSKIGARKDLGRPATSAIENKNAFMKFLEG
ncbi:MAG: phosphonopyruvate decarboxylase [Synergistaceae bacterium]|nr:phosphonopyruvate decarboxylase [Synergistaceae bacterium]MBQ3450629.1 phosphonopyruvate decarboxylase [Synergistaceae bacterium]